MSYIKCEDLVLGYEGIPVAENISFEVGKGDYLCILGENGAGKSTLMKTLLGLMPLMGGSIAYGDGLERYEIGYLPQQTFVQKDFPASVWEIVLSGALSKCGRRAFFGKEEKMLAEKNMKRMDIWELKKECYRNLSGGQQQRVLLARALCAAEKILVLDEPVTGLDPAAASALYGIVQDLNNEGMASVMVTHDLKNIVNKAGKILHINEGGYFYGTVDGYMASDYSKIFV